MSISNLRQFFFTTIFVACFLSGKGQDEVSSLKAIMKSSAAYDVKMQAYLSFGEKYGLRDFDETLKVAGEGMALAENKNDNISLGNIKRHIGTAYYFKGNYDVAARYYYESIALLEPAGQKRNLALVYNDLAKLYRKTGSLDRAVRNYDLALAIFIQLQDSAGISMIQNESGVVYEYKRDYAEATRRYQASYSISLKLKDDMGVSYALSNLAGVFTLQHKLTEAEIYLKHALELRRHLNDSLALGIVYLDVAANYYSQKKYETAKLYADSSSVIAQLLNYTELQTGNYKILADIAKETGKYKEAFLYLEKRTIVNDSLFGTEKIKQIEELNAKYETLKNEKIIQQQQFEINKRNYWIAGGTIFLLLIILSGLSFYKRSRLEQETNFQRALLANQEQSARDVLGAEENERQRVAQELHDGIGQMMSVAKMNLSSLENHLSFETKKQQDAFIQIMSLVDDSCKEIRSVSHNMMPNALLKNNLAEALRTFVSQVADSAMKIQLYTEGLDEKTDSNIEAVLYRIIQETVTNILKHANADTVDISVIKDQDGISGTIEDNGKGFNVAGVAAASGIGIKNIKSRVAYLKGTVEILSSPGAGTLVSLHIPAGK